MIPPQASEPLPYLSRLRRKIAAVGNGLCVGIDPPVDGLPPFFSRQLASLGSGAYLDAYTSELLAVAAGVAPAVKFQSAYFEAHGAEGFAALGRGLAKARELGLITILDAKRGDIASTMKAYGAMAFDVMGADALTITPYMGLDVAEALLPWLKAGRGVYVVWVTSNPGGRLVQEQRVQAQGRDVWLAEALLDALAEYFDEQGVAGALGIVLGATKVESLSPGLIAKLARVGLLMPGVGAQGGEVTARLRDLIATTGTALVPLSRGIGALPDDCQSWADYRRVVSGRLTQAVAEVT